MASSTTSWDSNGVQLLAHLGHPHNHRRPTVQIDTNDLLSAYHLDKLGPGWWWPDDPASAEVLEQFARLCRLKADGLRRASGCARHSRAKRISPLICRTYQS